MATKRRGRFRRQMKAPGKAFWLRPPFTDISLRDAANGVYSDIILAPSDFEEPNEALNDTSKGAPVIERLIVDVRYAQVVSGDYFSPGSFGQVTMLVEAMVFLQPDQFAPLVVSSATFNQTLQNQRILGYSLMEWDMSDTVTSVTRVQVRCNKHFEPKSRVRLREQSVAVAIRTNFDVSDASILSTFPSVAQTFLVRQP